jgi:hypothetical protein
MDSLRAFMNKNKDTGQNVVGGVREGEKRSLPTICYLLRADRGIALVSALLISLAVSLLIMSTVYFIIQSTRMSGAGKRYATASEAADGAVEVMKDAINLIMMGEPVSSLPIVDANPPCLADSIAFTENAGCTTILTLPGAGLFDDYKASITVTRLYSTWLPGSRLEFARAGGGAPASAVYFRINTTVSGPGGTRAETAALYRLVQ